MYCFLLATFLLNNYKQALSILHETPRALEVTKADLGITGDTIFEEWLAEERVYLEGLKKEPPVETTQMEYYQRLINLWNSE